MGTARRGLLGAIGLLCVLALPAPASAATVTNGAIAYEDRVATMTCDQCGENGDSETVGGQSRINLIRPDGTHRRRLACTSTSARQCEDHTPIFDRRGKRLAIAGNTGLLIRRPLGAQLVRFPTSSGPFWSWSPDGRRLASVGSVLGADGKKTFGIVTTDLRGRVRLARKVRDATNVSWSKSGMFAWDDGIDAYEPGSVWIAASAKAKPIRVTRFGYRPRWSFNGRRLAFFCKPGLCVTRRDGSGRRLLTRACAREGNEPSGAGYAWAPNGRALACVSKKGDLITVALPSKKVRVVRSGLNLDGDEVGDIDWQPRIKR